MVLGSKNDFTVLNTNLYGIAFHRDADYYLPIENVNEIPADGLLDLRSTTLMLRTKHTMTCSLSIISGDLGNIKEHCGFHVMRRPLPKTVYRLADNILFLSNIAKIHVDCAPHNFTGVIPVQKPQMILFMQCGCTFIFDTILYYSFTSNCAENQNVSDSLQISYAVNLALLTEFFKGTNLNLIKPDHLFDDEISVDLPKLSIASKIMKPS